MRRLAVVLSCAACNSLLGIHDLGGDAGGAGGDATPYVCTTDADCADPYAYCNTAPALHACDCVAGYAVQGLGCEWSGVVADPGFENGSDSPWALAGSALIDGSGSGSIDPGFAVMGCPGEPNQPLLQQTAALPAASQIVTLPRRSRAQPLVLTTTAEASAQKHGPGDMQWDFALGGVWTAETLSDDDQTTWATQRVCLGAAAYAPEGTTGSGAPRSLAAVVAATQQNLCNNSGLDLEGPAVDHVDIVPANAGECPDPGTVQNGDAEGSGGWTFTTSANADGTTAGIAAGVGAGSSAGVELAVASTCDSAAAATLVSVPLPDGSGSPMLSFYHRSSGAGGRATIDGNPLHLGADTVGAVDSYCLPSYMTGGVYAFAATLDVGGTCEPTDTAFVLDDVAVANDPSCASPGGIADGGFESDASVPGLTLPTATALATILADPMAHGGSHDLELDVTETCAASDYQFAVVPAANAGGSGSGGPAIAFWYRAPEGSFAFDAYVDGVAVSATAGSAWQQATACLYPHGDGILQTFDIELYGSPGSGSCSAPASQELLIDDLALTPSPACTPLEP